MRKSSKNYIFIVLAVILFGALRTHAQIEGDYNLPPINYSKTKAKGKILLLERELQQWIKPHHQSHDILKKVLELLKIPVSSQCLVFSKTSKQRDLISPKTPRAIYFNEDFYVGYALGGLIELTTADSELGMVFYVINPFKKEKLVVERDDTCLSCHATANTNNVPGLFVRSVYADDSGEIIGGLGGDLTLPSSPFKSRWGGWYVTGNHGDVAHLGNKTTEVIIKDNSRDRKKYKFSIDEGNNMESLESFFDVKQFLRPTSDILALMLLEHQSYMHNLFSSSRIQYLRYRYLRVAFLPKGVKDKKIDELMSKTIERYSNNIVKGLLFTGEAKLPVDGIQGSKEFEKDFVSMGRKDKEGDSLRDLRLQKRLFKYRCSYMIHSKSFFYLPRPIKNRVIAKLYSQLQREDDPEFLTFSKREKKRIHKILLETHQKYKEFAGTQ